MKDLSLRIKKSKPLVILSLISNVQTCHQLLCKVTCSQLIGVLAKYDMLPLITR